ncbi:hypothetical protein AAV98_18425 [Bacillus sp. CHD6a]|nr:hypothetical protein AAV98_18425 [Bacillus sp. CHD6a]
MLFLKVCTYIKMNVRHPLLPDVQSVRLWEGGSGRWSPVGRSYVEAPPAPLGKRSHLRKATNSGVKTIFKNQTLSQSPQALLGVSCPPKKANTWDGR